MTLIFCSLIKIAIIIWKLTYLRYGHKLQQYLRNGKIFSLHDLLYISLA